MHGRKVPAPASRRPGIRRPPVWRLLGLQVLLSLGVCLLALRTDGIVALQSGLAGLLVAVLPNILFVMIAFRHRGARAARRAVADLYLAEACKFAATIALFAIVFVGMQPLAGGWLFASYIAALCAYWLSPLLGTRPATVSDACSQAS